MNAIECIEYLVKGFELTEEVLLEVICLYQLSERPIFDAIICLEKILGFFFCYQNIDPPTCKVELKVSFHIKPDLVKFLMKSYDITETETRDELERYYIQDLYNCSISDHFRSVYGL